MHIKISLYNVDAVQVSFHFRIESKVVLKILFIQSPFLQQLEEVLNSPSFLIFLLNAKVSLSDIDPSFPLNWSENKSFHRASLISFIHLVPLNW